MKLESPEFEKEFAVYSNDQVGARYILSNNMMERLVEFKNKTNEKVYLSFVDSKVYVAISIEKDLFEPPRFKPVNDISLVQEFFDDMNLAIGIVDDLNLNTRIWSKT